MKLNFTTLFNINYLSKGLALHESLLNNCTNFHLYIFAFDEATFKILNDKKLAFTTIISTQEFENESLLAVKTNRNIAEYCWTCTPFTIKYCIEKFELDCCTYIDADIYFYSDPSKLISGMDDNSVLITPHNYYHEYDQSAISGIYCVQFTSFKNTPDGLRVLNWWLNACLKWCYAEYEDGKMGDQKYLDSWPYMFDGVQICKNPGAGLAPWNLLTYTFKKNNDVLYVNNEKLIFFHFHALKHLSNNKWYLGGYRIQKQIIVNIYNPYINALNRISEKTYKQFDGITGLGTTDKSKVLDLTLKFKIGIYILDFKQAISEFYLALFFIKRRRFYKENFIKIN